MTTINGAVSNGLWLPDSFRQQDAGEKAAALDLLNRSAQGEAVPSTPRLGVSSMLLFGLAQAADTMIAWGSHVMARDRQLRAFWPSEPFLAGTVFALSSRYAAMHWKVMGTPRTAEASVGLIQNANYGAGWEDFASKLAIDLMTCDNGAYIELIRQQDSPDSPVVMFANLDSNRCHGTGVPETPVIYEDANGKYHLLKWYQVVQLLEMPSPITQARMGAFYRTQYSAVTRVLRAAQIIKAIGIYNEEKITGRFMRGVHLLSGVTAEAVSDAIARANMIATQQGQMSYMQPALVGSINPEAKVESHTLDLASLPEAWDEEKSFKWYITALALGFGTDYGELAPLPGQGLGTATQSETMNAKSRGKAQGLFQALVLRLFNLYGILPANAQFEWDETDIDAAQREAVASDKRAEERARRLQSGEINVEVGQRRALATGDLTQEEFDDLRLAAEEMEDERLAQQEAEQAALATGGQPAVTPSARSKPKPATDAMTEGEERTEGARARLVGMLSLDPERGQRAISTVPFGTLITSRLHRAYATVSDDASALGYFPKLEDRLAVASAIGPALAKFEDDLREAGVWDIPVAPEDADALLEMSVKAVLDDPLGEERLALETEMAGKIGSALDKVRLSLNRRARDLAKA